MTGTGFLGTNASLLADVTLALSLLVALLLTAGAFLAIRGQYNAHRWVQTVAVALNTVLVLTVMVGSFVESAATGIPQKLGEPYYAAAAAHGLVGLFAFAFGTFVMLRGNEMVPAVLKFDNYKLFMRIAYGGYLLATALGVWVYAAWYMSPAVAAPPPSSQARNEVIVPMANFAFSPRELVVAVGTTVVWTNQDGAPHTATSDDGKLFTSDLLSRGQSFRHTFTEVGEFPYFCDLHGAAGGVDMAGVIRVVPAGEAPAVAAPAVPPVAPTEQPTPAPPADLPATAAEPIRALLVRGPGLPSEQGYAVGLRRQAEELRRHAQFAADSANANELAGLRRHAEHVYNLVAGSLDPRFGDLNGDGRSQNPGDGYGLLPNGTQPGYIQAVDRAAGMAAGAADATGPIKLHAGHVQVCAANLRGWAEEARGLALQLAQVSSTEPARVERLLQLAAWIERGADTNGDGELAPIPGEGGSLVAYEHARFMAGLAPAGKP